MKAIPYVCAGDPDLPFSEKLIRQLAPYVDAIEIGIPFSDPIADGKTIQGAGQRALKNGVTTDKVFAMVERLRRGGIGVPLVFMTYYNIVHAYGCQRFLQKTKAVGVQGIIIPDLPMGEDEELETAANEAGIAVVRLIAPNTPVERAEQILQKETLFTYLVSIAGTTGAREHVSEESIAFVKRIRALAGKEKKLFVGFGIANADQAKQFANAGADGVIVGSEIINRYMPYLAQGRETEALNAAEALVRGLKGSQ